MMGEEEEISPTLETETELVPFFVWEENLELLEMYQVLMLYLKEGYALDSPLLLALITDAAMPLKPTLTYIYYIHSEYVNLVREPYDNQNAEA